jgi:VWFA-related protein
MEDGRAARRGVEVTVRTRAGSLIGGFVRGVSVSKSVLAGSLALGMLVAQAQAQPPVQAQAAQQTIPDAPKPQSTLPNLGSIAPGKGTTSTSADDTLPSDAAAGSPPATSSPAQVTEPVDSQPPPQLPTTSADADKVLTLMGAGANYVEVPFIVKDSKGKPVAGLTWRDVRVYENGLLQHLEVFTVSPRAMSAALVIDQSMTRDNMTRVNDALGALQEAFAPYDEVAVFTYNNGPRMVTDFTGAKSARLTQEIERSKSSGRDIPLAGSGDGPISQTTVINNQNFDPNTSANRGHSSMQINQPRDVHTLNDAILAAATALSKTAPGRLRVIYVISDGKEYGSAAKYKEVVQYLQTNRIGVYGTLVGDSSLPVLGFLDGIHLPLMMRDNVLPAYAKATGGDFDAEFRTGAIEKSFAKITDEVRNQYTVGYLTHEPFIDGKYRQLEVRVLNHGNDLGIFAKKGYWPAAMEAVKPRTVSAAQ